MRTARLIPLLCALLALAGPSSAAPGAAIQAAFAKKHRPLFGRFLHITDFHVRISRTSCSRPFSARFLSSSLLTPSHHQIDKYYRAGTTIGSSCHRRKKKHPPDQLAGPLGAPGTRCDSPFALADATVSWIKNNWMDKIDFIVWTGDSARHDSDSNKPRTKKEIIDNNEYITNLFLKTFADIASNSTSTSDSPSLRPDLLIPIVASIGNNDVYPHNILGPGPNNPTLHAFFSMWKPFIPEDQLHTFHEGGWYVVEVIPETLRILALNTMYFFKANAAADGCSDPDEPGSEQMEWMEVQLQRARMDKVKVYLTGHVPPKRKAYFPSCWKKYGELGLEYQDVIIGHLFGHMNLDHFFLMSKKDIEDAEYPNVEEEDGEIDLWQDAPTFVDNETSFYTGPSSGPVTMGARRYLELLFDQYSTVGKNDNVSQYVVINVSPPVVPNFYPTFRVFQYDMRQSAEGNKKEVVPIEYTQFFTNLTKWNSDESSDVTGDENKDGSEGEDEGEDEEEDEGEDEDEGENNGEDSLAELKKKKKKKKKKDRRWQLEFEVEYSTSKSYGMPDLTPQSWLDMARRMASEGRGGEGVWRKYVERMFVQTRNGSDWA